jgi:hypothetical protein
MFGMMIVPWVMGVFAFVGSGLIAIFDAITGVDLIKGGKIACFLQATRSMNILNFVFLMTSGRELKDCVFLSLVSFFLPFYFNRREQTRGGELKDYLAVGVFLELYFSEYCKRIAAKFPWSITLATVFVRVWLLWVLNEEIFNRALQASAGGGGGGRTGGEQQKLIVPPREL